MRCLDDPEISTLKPFRRKPASLANWGGGDDSRRIFP